MTSYKISVTLLFIFLLGSGVKAQEKIFSIEAGPEYRHEDFRWSIAGNIEGTNPNILSELIFKPINAMGFFVKGESKFAKRFSADISYNRLYTYKGEVTDFDYDGDNRTLPATELFLQSNKGFMRNLNFGVNFYPIKKENVELLTGLGYNSTKEVFYLTDFNNEALNSTYKANWNGHYVKLKILSRPVMKFEIGGEIKIWPDYFQINNLLNLNISSLSYNAKANWNLVESFQHPVSFTHHAKGHGLDYRLFLGFKPNDFLSIGIHGLHSNWKTGFGTDKLFQTDGQIIKARMNGAFRKNFGLRLTTTVSF